MLYLAHDRPHRWRQIDLDSAEALAGDAAIAVRSARTFGRMATWTAQLQSIQRLGSRLSGLTDVREIGHAIATELRQLIDYHNVRVYRTHGEDLDPGRHAGPRRGLLRRDGREPAGGGRRGRDRLGRQVPRAAARRRHRERPARDHDPGLRARHRRVDAAGADGPRGRLPRRARALEARAAPVHRGRPAAARDLRLVRGPGDDQRRRHGPPQGAVERARAPAGRPARAAAHDGVDPDHPRPAGGAGADHRPARRPDPLRQHRHRGRRPRRRHPHPAHGPRRPRRGVHGVVGAGRDRHRDLGRRAQRAGPDRGREDGRPRQPLPGHGRHRRQPDRRSAARPGRRRRRADAGAPRGLPPASTSRSSSSSSCSPRRSRSPSATRRSSGRPRCAPGPTT